MAFTAAGSGGVAPFAYSWVFGDGASSAAQNPSHTYAAAGTYAAGLTVTDSRGVKVTAGAMTITVHPALSASTSAAPVSGVAKLRVTFRAGATGGLAPYTYAWNFGDGTTGSGAAATHAYRAGIFHPTLTVSDAAGRTWRGAAGVITVTKHARNASPAPASGAIQGPAAPSTPASPPSPAPSSQAPSDPVVPSVSPPAAQLTAGDQPSAARGGAAGVLPILLLLGSVLVTGGGTVFFLRWLWTR